MERISGAYVAANLYGAGKHGFTNGVPGSVAPTVVSAAWLNAVQEQIARAVELSAMSLNGSDNDQLARAISARAVGMAVANHQACTVPGTPGIDFKNLCYDASIDTWVAVSTTGGPWRSTDGAANWSDAFDPEVDAVATNGAGLFVAVGQHNVPGTQATCISSTDGAAWTARTLATFTGSMNAICYGASLWVCAGSAGEIQTSTNGTTGWTKRTPGDSFAGTFYGAAYGNGAYVLVGEDSTNSRAMIQRSTDGTTWTRIDSGITGLAYLKGVATDGAGTWVAVGYDTAVKAVSVVSRDNGLTWTQVTMPSTVVATSLLHSVAYSPQDKAFAAVGNSGLILVSGDGSAWRDVSQKNFVASMQGIAYGDGMFVIAADDDTIRRSLRLNWAA